MTLQVKGRVVRSEMQGYNMRFILDIEQGHEVHYVCDPRNGGFDRLADIMRGCGKIHIVDTDELDGCTFEALIEHDDIRSFIPKLPAKMPPAPKRPSWLQSLGQDWIRAPLSGTVVAMSVVAAAVSFWRGDIALGLICLTYGEVVSMRRGPFKEDDDG